MVSWAFESGVLQDLRDLLQLLVFVIGKNCLSKNLTLFLFILTDHLLTTIILYCPCSSHFTVSTFLHSSLCTHFRMQLYQVLHFPPLTIRRNYCSNTGWTHLGLVSVVHRLLAPHCSGRKLGTELSGTQMNYSSEVPNFNACSAVFWFTLAFVIQMCNLDPDYLKSDWTLQQKGFVLSVLTVN